MKKILVLTSAILFVAAVVAGPASAQDRYSDDRDSRSHYDDDRDDRDDRRYGDDRNDRNDRHDNRRADRRHDRREDRQDRRADRRDRRQDNRRYWAQQQYRNSQRYVQPRGYRYTRWNVGNRLPYGYYGSNYYVDHRAYRLNAPYQGHRWVRVDNDVYMVATRTGLVADILYGLFR